MIKKQSDINKPNKILLVSLGTKIFKMLSLIGYLIGLKIKEYCQSQFTINKTNRNPIKEDLLRHNTVLTASMKTNYIIVGYKCDSYKTTNTQTFKKGLQSLLSSHTHPSPQPLAAPKAQVSPGVLHQSASQFHLELGLACLPTPTKMMWGNWCTVDINMEGC